MKVKRLREGAIPCLFPWSKPETPASRNRADRTENRQIKRRRLMDEMTKKEEVIVKDCVDNEDIFISTLNVQECEVSAKGSQEQTVDMNCQTGWSGIVRTEESQCQTPGYLARMTLTDFIYDKEGLCYYTGIQDYETFQDVLRSLGPAAFHLSYWNSVSPAINVPDQLLLTLIKLRSYRPNFELSRMFKIPESDVYGVIITWIKFMSLQWQEVDLWPDRDLVNFFSPSDFRAKFPMTRVILDGLEIPVKKPSNPAAQQITFSSYKNRNTAKVVAGITPGGLISYLSPAYGGSASDRQIIERSWLTKRTDPTDAIMADKGFDMQDIFAPYDVTVNIPTFFRKKNRLSSKTVLHDRRFASKRVHVERVIGMAKTFKILTQPLGHTESLLSSDIMFVCFMLVNFRKCIVPRNAWWPQ